MSAKLLSDPKIAALVEKAAATATKQERKRAVGVCTSMLADLKQSQTEKGVRTAVLAAVKGVRAAIQSGA